VTGIEEKKADRRNREGKKEVDHNRCLIGFLGAGGKEGDSTLAEGGN